MESKNQKARATGAKKAAASQPNHGSATDVDALTTKAITAINTEVGSSWVRRGQLVDEYVESLKVAGCKSDPYKLLAEHRDALKRQPNMLRYYHDAYKLWRKLGGEKGAPKLSMTHFIKVLPQNIAWPKKARLLEMATEQGWSVSELEEKIHGKGHSGVQPHSTSPAPNDNDDAPEDDGVINENAPGVAAVPIDWETELDTEVEESLEQFTALAAKKAGDVVPANTRTKLLTLVRVIVTKFLTEEEARELLPK